MRFLYGFDLKFKLVCIHVVFIKIVVLYCKPLQLRVYGKFGHSFVCFANIKIIAPQSVHEKQLK